MREATCVPTARVLLDALGLEVFETAYKEFPGRSHFTVGQEGWEEVTDFALRWALDPIEL